jgi:carbon storage regulator CsrA
MLVLTRKSQERIHIGDNITITLVRIQGNTVRIGIEAPGDVRVVRGEVVVRDQLELAAAEAETPAASPDDGGIIAFKCQPPLARIAANKLRLRRPAADSRCDSQPPREQVRGVAAPEVALKC